jgi:hypothetical protein
MIRNLIHSRAVRWYTASGPLGIPRLRYHCLSWSVLACSISSLLGQPLGTSMFPLGFGSFAIFRTIMRPIFSSATVKAVMLTAPMTSTNRMRKRRFIVHWQIWPTFMQGCPLYIRAVPCPVTTGLSPPLLATNDGNTDWPVLPVQVSAALVPFILT